VLEIQLRQTDGRLSRAIDVGLARLRAGTFGVCEVWKHSIPKARLEAVP
jgi:RNA polymerase-binding transcription factor DksA